MAIPSHSEGCGLATTPPFGNPSRINLAPRRVDTRIAMQA